MIDWKFFSPELVSKYVSFNRDNKNWIYSNKKDMPSLQAEGVAGICQRLARHKIAFLADEVGMGKTIQAFGVMSMLWQNEKYKNARVLVFAPRREVAKQWEREYKDFYEKHRKDSTVIPEATEDNVIVLDRLSEKEGHEWLGSVANKRLVIAKTTSLSYLTNDTEEDAYKSCAEKLVEEMKKFDLVVIDEAQYFRNSTSRSLRSIAASILFKKIDCHVLLMSATPNHSAVTDLRNIVDNFNTVEILDDDENLWNKLVIRRFRVLSKKRYIKYNYRKEIDLPAYFQHEKIDKDEIFFALYQKRLLEESSQRNMGEGREFWRYLEGTEFDPRQFTKLDAREDDSDENRGNDHDSAEDRIILKELVKEFKNAYDDISPENPKYKKTRKELLSQDYKKQSKVLVFSRRIPSVKELAKGVVDQYDELMWKMIKNELGGSGKIPTRRSFKKRCIRVLKPHKQSDDEAYSKKRDDATDFYHRDDSLHSEVLSWFRPMKVNPEEKKFDYTEASRFVRRFDTTAKHEGGYRYLFEMDNSNSFWMFDDDIKKLLLELNFSDNEKKGLERLIRKAARYASIGVVELFCCHVSAVKHKEDFFAVVRKRWHKKNMKIRLEILDMIDNFRLYYSKIIGLNEKELSGYEWKEFDNALPVYAYTASSRNEGVIKRFNSPFFPEVLVSTSVLQEGVNLQFFCNKIVHYGISWTAGDDEQRIGRIDRMLSLTERNLDLDRGEACLDICYPYLDKTHDEKRLGDFLIKKRDAESILDKGEVIYKNDLNDMVNDIPIKSLLRTPRRDTRKADPYPWQYEFQGDYS